MSIGHVAIVGLGPSAEHYVDICKRVGGRQAFCDETWVINTLGDTLACDRIFHMDDVRIQQVRAEAKPNGNIARMLDWLKTTKTPVYTSRTHPNYPALVEFPLEDVINDLGYAYFNSTAAYAVALAIHLNATKISCFGMDFTYPNSHDAEKGRGCVEFWLGTATARGITMAVSDRSSLVDSCMGEQARIYGYDTRDVKIVAIDGKARVSLIPHDRLPTAEEIEAAYDHSKHPNPLVRS